MSLPGEKLRWNMNVINPAFLFTGVAGVLV